MEKWISRSWYGGLPWTWLLWPLQLLYAWMIRRKRAQFLVKGIENQGVPIVVVGNITVGGTGKTPVVQALVRYLSANGLKCAVISRGYGGSCEQFPHEVQSDDDAGYVGDEPYLLRSTLGVPVIIDPVRLRSIAYANQLGVDVIISDDGLQHYQMPRDIELCLLDGSRGIGNGQLLPVGPLREPFSRLVSVDHVLASGPFHEQGIEAQVFQIRPDCWVNVKTGEELALSEFELKANAKAIAGIGNPHKFFATLAQLGIECKHQAFADHYQFTEQDRGELQGQILMTEKDAVKINSFAHEDMWYLRIDAQLPQACLTSIFNRVKRILEKRHG